MTVAAGTTTTQKTSVTSPSGWRFLTLRWMVLAAVACVAAVIAVRGSLHPSSSVAHTATSLVDLEESRIFSYLQQRKDRFLMTIIDDGGGGDTPTTNTHQPIFNPDHATLFPLTTSDYYGFFFAILGLMVAAGGGIGGGGILVPIYLLVFGFSPKYAIPLSNITVFGGACANVLLNASKRHPRADRPLVDWDLILVIEPPTIAGALLGAFLNKILPELLLTFLLVVLLSFTAYATLGKAQKLYRAETLAQQKASGTSKGELMTLLQHNKSEQDEEAPDKLNTEAETHPAGDSVIQESPATKSLATIAETPTPKAHDEPPEMRERREELEQMLKDERHTPLTNIRILVTIFVVVIVINLLKGGGSFSSPLGIECGSRAFWIANAVMLGWIAVAYVFVRHYLLNKYHAKKRCGYQYQEGDIQWDARATIVYPVVCCVAGFFAGMFGIGGGIVKGPLMLAVGVHPAVSSASSATMILFTSFTATTSFVVFGLLVFDYGVACVLIGFFATLAGQFGLSFLMNKSKRSSYIAFSIGGVVLLSAVLMTFQSIISIASGEKHQSGGICGVGV